MGVTCPLGNNLDEMWRRAVGGESGIGPMARTDPSAYGCQVAGEVDGFEPERYIDRRDARRMARFSQFAVAVSRQAIEHAGLELDDIDRERVGTFWGSGGGGLPQTDRTLIERGGHRLDPLYMAKMLPNMAAGNVSIQLGLLGYTNTVSTACAAGTQAIGDAVEVIRRGAADVMMAGGVHGRSSRPRQPPAR